MIEAIGRFNQCRAKAKIYFIIYILYVQISFFFFFFLGLSTITNVKRGDFYGICTSWSNSDKRRWGCLLLYKAFHILLHDGERQIRPIDL